MKELEGFIDAPMEPVFFNVRPQEGFRLIESVSVVPGDFLPVKEIPSVKVLPREGEPAGMLLLPVGKTMEARNAFFPDGEPLFQRFADLETDDAIVDFASEFGPLRPGVPFDLSLNEARLESVSLWRTEISLMRAVLRLVGDYEDEKPVDEDITRQGKRVVVHIRGSLSGQNVFLDFDPGETERETVFRGFVGFFNRKLQECPSSPARILHEGKVRSVLVPESLQAALWLQLSHSIFRDGPSDIAARRCFVTGLYFPEKYMGKPIMKMRTVGPNKGRWYHKDMKHRFYQQKYARKVAASEGRVVKEGRRGKTEFIVEEF